MFQLQEMVIFEIGWVEITVHPPIVDGVKMYQVLPVSSHTAETGSTTKKHNLQIFMTLIGPCDQQMNLYLHTCSQFQPIH